MSLVQEHFKRVRPGVYVPKRGWHYNSSHPLPSEDYDPEDPNISLPCIVRVGNKWRSCKYNPKDSSTLNPWGPAHSTLERAVQDFLGADRPLQIRPLQRVGPKKWKTHCSQFMVVKRSDGWGLDFVTTICALVWPQINVDDGWFLWSDWCARHGLDRGLDTLQEVLERLETAERVDPIRHVGSVTATSGSKSPILSI